MTSGIRILLIEDNAYDAASLAEVLLSRVDFVMDTAKRLSHAQDLLRDNKFHCVILDLGLPDSSEDRSADIQRIVQQAHAPVIVLTGLNDEDVAIEAIRQGAQDFIVKDGLSADVLARSILYAIERWSMSQTIREQQRLLEVSRQKEEFIALLTHDLKNPLLSFARIYDVMADGGLGPVSDEMTTVISHLKTSNKHLVAMVENAITAYRFEQHPWLQHPTWIPLHELVQEILSDYLAEMARRCLTLDTQIAETVVQGDNCHLRRAIQNIIDNAVKFTPDGGSIGVVLKCSDRISLTVSDSGGGVGFENPNCIFEKFKQSVDGARYRASMGMGLYVTKLIVDAHNGKVDVESRSGKGTSITITLPPCAMAAV